MCGAISLLNVYCGLTMIEVWMGFRAANRLRSRQRPDRRLFFCAGFTSYYVTVSTGSKKNNNFLFNLSLQRLKPRLLSLNKTRRVV